GTVYKRGRFDEPCLLVGCRECQAHGLRPVGQVPGGSAHGAQPVGLAGPVVYTRRFLGGRQPLCGRGVTSSMALVLRPAACRAVIADSRPEPGPLTRTSISLRPNLDALSAAVSAAFWAAYGVLLRLPLKPTVPAEA